MRTNEPPSWAGSVGRLASGYRERLLRKSLDVVVFLQARMVLVLLLWLLFTVPICLLRLATGPTHIASVADAAPILLAYSAIIAAPAFGYWVGAGAFMRKETRGQPRFRWAVYGKWRAVDEGEARAHPDYGPLGFLTSLVVGLLLNVVLRTAEFFLGMPAIGLNAPEWGLALFVLMAADVAIFGFFYLVAFAMAMKSVPLFPRMLLFIWMLDIFVQLIIAQQISLVGNLPVAVAGSLTAILQGNIYKVLISMLVWLPYLLLSRRVNVTYRHRLEEASPTDGDAETD